MEIKIGHYGRMMFEIMTGKDSGLQHWESIRARAEPLVRELLRLNEEMKPNGGYQITGYINEKGKKKLSKHERIDLAQQKLWGVPAEELKVGDKVWLPSSTDHEMYVGQNSPCPVEFIKGDIVGVEVDMWGEEIIVKIHKSTKVLRAPNDWKEKEPLYCSDEYWLEQAEKFNL